jgi:pimeloyl-ACP methyl ester carboxylesterase
MNPEIIQEGKFQFIEKGEGPVLLSLHGLFGALSNFADLFNHFSGRFRVIIPLMPIYGLSVEDTHVKSLAAFIKEFIEFKNLEKVNLLGNSLGGHVALVYTVANPEKVNLLILTGSSGLYENAFGGSFPRREDKEFIRNRVAFTFYDPKNATDELVDEVFGLINDREKLIRILALAKSAIRHNMAEELHNIKCSVCLIWGKQDGITPPEVAEDFHKLLPHSELFWIDKCGHAPMMEQPNAFNQILDAWLAKQKF